MLDLKTVREEVMELTGDEELAEKLEQLVWARLSFFDEKLQEFDQRLAVARESQLANEVMLPFLAGFSLACLGCLVIFWGC